MPGKKIRRDTHDDAVPDEVFHLLEQCANKCSNLKFVVLEQLSNGLAAEAERIQFGEDFQKLESIVKRINKDQARPIPYNDFMPVTPVEYPGILEDGLLRQQQSALSGILENATSLDHVQQLLQNSILANSDWGTENWEPCMLETAIAIAQKWKEGFA